MHYSLLVGDVVDTVLWTERVPDHAPLNRRGYGCRERTVMAETTVTIKTIYGAGREGSVERWFLTKEKAVGYAKHQAMETGRHTSSPSIYIVVEGYIRDDNALYTGPIVHS